jgi:hypothetical protein
MLTMAPPVVKVPVLGERLVFVATVYWTTALPVPFALAPMVIHGTFESVYLGQAS